MSAWQRFDSRHLPWAQLPSGQVPDTTSMTPPPRGRWITQRLVSMQAMPLRQAELSQRVAAMQKVSLADSEV